MKIVINYKNGKSVSYNDLEQIAEDTVSTVDEVREFIHDGKHRDIFDLFIDSFTTSSGVSFIVTEKNGDTTKFISITDICNKYNLNYKYISSCLRMKNSVKCYGKLKKIEKVVDKY